MMNKRGVSWSHGFTDWIRTGWGALALGLGRCRWVWALVDLVVHGIGEQVFEVSGKSVNGLRKVCGGWAAAASSIPMTIPIYSIQHSEIS